jgi:hypothetical protein
MSLQPYVFPPSPSPQVKAVLEMHVEYDIDGLKSLMTDDFTLKTLPVNLGAPDRTKDVVFAGLKEVQTTYNGKPLAVSRSQAHRDHPFSANLLDSILCTMLLTGMERLGFMYDFSGTHKLESTLISPHLGKDRHA